MSRNQNRKGGSKRGRPDEWGADARDPSSLQNAAFEAYYKEIGIVPEEQWAQFLECLKTGLPMTVRVNPCAAHADNIDAYVMEHLSSVFETKRLPFIPRQMAIQCGVSRGDLKRNSEFKTTKKVVAALNEGGFLTRQETVSMLPPLLLRVQPGQRVLDMCAAPGSKTSQILECLLPDPHHGLVVANDVNSSRLDVLHHQTNRLAGAHPHVIITNYDATRFPILPSAWRFDRVLCDVMCSGDGTLRKSLDMWPRWNTLQGADLHTAQTRVLMRGMASCKKNGVVVYSTCSLNPVEDEAVVSECLRQANGAFRLVDAGSLLPGLKGTPGLTTWGLTTKDLTTVLHTLDEAHAYARQQEEEGKRRGFQYKASMFPNTDLLKAQNIEYVRRVLPHDQDTGGFFVAAFECVEELPISATVMDEKTAEVPLKPISATMRDCIRTAFGLSADDESTFPFDQLLFRSETTREQKVYFANKDTIALSALLGHRVMSVGSKIFESYSKYSNEKLRMSADGVATLAALCKSPPSSRYVLNADPQLLLELATGKAVAFDTFAERLGVSLDSIPTPTCVLACALDLVGPVYAVAERQPLLSGFTAKVPDWQVTLCKLQLGIPLVSAPAGADPDRDDEDDKTDGADTA